MTIVQLIVSIALLLVFLYVLFSQARTHFIPEQIRRAFRTAPVNRLLSIQQLEILHFTPRGVQVRFNALVVKSKPPPFLWFLEARASVSTVQIADAGDGEPIAEIRLSDPVNVVGTADVVVNQENLEVEFVGLEKVKTLLRRVEIGGAKEVDRITMRVTITVTSVHLWGYLFLDNLVLQKEMNVGKLRVDAAAAQARYQAEEKAAIEAAELAEAQAKAAIEQASKEEYEAEVDVLTKKYHAKRVEGHLGHDGTLVEEHDDEIDLTPVENGTSLKDGGSETVDSPDSEDGTVGVEPESKDDHPNEDDQQPNSDDDQPTYSITDPLIPRAPLATDLPLPPTTPTLPPPKPRQPLRVGAESLFPSPTFTILPVVASLQSITTGLMIHFTAPPTLTLTIQSVRFSVYLNGNLASTGTISNIHISPDTLSFPVALEIIPEVMARPISGLFGMARGVLRGAFAGTVNGLMTGEWGQGAAVIGVRDIQIVDGEGKRMEWVEGILASMDMEKDLDAVRTVKAHAGEAVGTVKQGVWALVNAVLDAASKNYGGRCVVM
ncbi:hypothetical protein HDV00_009196 [Rhizophlyctis rosea]|nr:hypothetical protein HDV00_009196 [Rhizophlyctis rosea]